MKSSYRVTFNYGHGLQRAPIRSVYRETLPGSKEGANKSLDKFWQTGYRGPIIVQIWERVSFHWQQRESHEIQPDENIRH